MLKIAVLGNSRNLDYENNLSSRFVICKSLKKLHKIAVEIQPDALLINEKRLLEPFLNQLSLMPFFHKPPIFVLDDEPVDYEDIINMAKQGVDYYFTKPLNIQVLIGKLKETSSEYRIKQKHSSPCFSTSLKHKAYLFSRENQPLILYGETGCGKNFLAQKIHDQCSHRNSPFSQFSCGSIPDSLFEAELFGTTKGAFTDSISRPGLLEMTGKGTLFLDEIGELSSFSQVKLLRLLEDRTFSRLGSTKIQKFEGRIILATHRNLKKMMKKKLFRKDLYYRINVLPLYIPPLRQRLQELPSLTNKILKQLGSNKGLSYKALLKLYKHKWPGNIRELHSVLVRANTISLSKKWIESGDIFFY